MTSRGFETDTSPLNGGQCLRMNCRGFEDFVSLGFVGNELGNGRGELKTCQVSKTWEENSGGGSHAAGLPGMGAQPANLRIES